MDYLLSREYDYVPEWEGNDKAPDPIVFHLRALSVMERDECMPYERADGVITIKPDKELLIKKAVISIDNFSISGEKIDTSEKWLASPSDRVLQNLFLEVVSEIMAHIAQDKKK